MEVFKKTNKKLEEKKSNEKEKETIVFHFPEEFHSILVRDSKPSRASRIDKFDILDQCDEASNQP